jgi:hypothetical protein
MKMRITILIGIIFAVSIAVFVAAFSVWVDFKQGGAVAGVTDNASWGAYGDYLGGVLNPLFAFGSFIVLIATIVVQTMELQATREEMQNSVEALRSQKDVAETQLAHYRHEAKKNNIHRIIESLEREISHELNKHIISSPTVTLESESLGEFFCDENKDAVHQYAERIDTAALSHKVSTLRKSILLLDDALTELRDLDTDNVMVRYYVHKHGYMINTMTFLGLLVDDSLTVITGKDFDV